MGLCGRRWPASPDLGPLVHTVYSVRTTGHLQEPVVSVAGMAGSASRPIVGSLYIWHEAIIL